MMDLRGQQQEKRLGMPNSLGGFGDPPTKISSINTTGNGIAILTSPRHAATTVDHHHHHHQQQQQQQQQHYHHHHHHQQQHQPHQQLKNRQDEERSPEPPALPPPQHHHHHHQTQQVIDTHTDRDRDRDRDPDPVSIAVVSAAIQPISTTGSNPRTPRSSKIRYRECLKNHAASIGGHVVDGCGEFMPGGEEGSVDALKCAACDCHRNFHRKELDGDQHYHHHLLHHHSHQHGGVSGGGNCFYCYNSNNKAIHDNSRRNARIPAHSVQPIQHQSQQQKFTLGLPSSGSPPVMMAFGGGSGGGGAATDSSSEDLNNTVFHSNAGSAGPGMMTPLGGMQFSLSKKRFRTKFTQEQKDRMLEFAEKVGWRIQKQDEIAVQQFCAEVGVKRQVLKVWMHNNKHAMKKKVDM